MYCQTRIRPTMEIIRETVNKYFTSNLLGEKLYSKFRNEPHEIKIVENLESGLNRVRGVFRVSNGSQSILIDLIDYESLADLQKVIIHENLHRAKKLNKIGHYDTLVNEGITEFLAASLVIGNSDNIGNSKPTYIDYEPFVLIASIFSKLHDTCTLLQMYLDDEYGQLMAKFDERYGKGMYSRIVNAANNSQEGSYEFVREIFNIQDINPRIYTEILACPIAQVIVKSIAKEKNRRIRSLADAIALKLRSKSLAQSLFFTHCLGIESESDNELREIVSRGEKNA